MGETAYCLLQLLSFKRMSALFRQIAAHPF